ncbi:hypothetical protein K7I13_07050 [Brucepastera parasyntrophica]|uniref:hypothetical protein n=1 Tax=Brucepastera parasyntrophica TaxID=2880008 RepID=UPI00210C87E3|nr:hypothetical protein [Brucepastera parasyntrophica]ULQ61003.1 hypothetical protein K7I13_07050 [Brucepastera parasyntrophica]
MEYYLGGYYVMALVPQEYENYKNKLICSCSHCINKNLVKLFSGIFYLDEQDNNYAVKYGRNNKNSKMIEKWVEDNYTNSIRWPDVFLRKEYAEDFNFFFDSFSEVKRFSIYFDENETNRLIKYFKPKNKSENEIGIYQILDKKIKENNDELLLGYDLIGMEISGDFHSFHCHSIEEELSNKFGIRINEYGLFDECSDWDPVLKALNNQEIGCEPVPWFVVKVKTSATE